MKTLRGAAAWVQRTGVALLFPKPDLVLPTLWEACGGTGEVEWGTDPVSKAWSWKEELAAKGLACTGKHVRGRMSVIGFGALPALYAMTGRKGAPDDYREPGLLSRAETEIVDAVLETAPLTAPAIRKAIGRTDTAKVNRTLETLQKMLILTHAGAVEQEQGWPAGSFDVLARRYAGHLKKLPTTDDARQSLARVVVAYGREVSAADVAAPFGWRRADAQATLDRLVEAGLATAGDDHGMRLWRAT